MVFLPFLGPCSCQRAIRLMGIGAVQFGAMYCLYIFSYRFLEGHEVALLTVTTPLFVVLVDGFRRRAFRLSAWAAAALAVLAGLVLVWAPDRGLPALMGLLLVQGANLCFALGQVCFAAIEGEEPDHRQFAWLYVGALLVPLLLLLPRVGTVQLPTELDQWLSLLYLGLLPCGLGFFLWNKGVRLVSCGLAATMNNLKLPLGVLVAWLVFAEAIDLPRLLSGCVLFAAAIWVARR